MQTILATGGTGYIGSHTCVELLKKGFKVIILDSLINSSSKVFEKIIKITERNNPEFVKNCSFVLGDIRDQNLLNNIFEKGIRNKNKIEAVIHFSGLKSVDESFLNPLEYWDANFCGTINLLKVIEKYSCSSLVFSSSATVYGVDTTSPIKESAVIKPINPYGKTKAAVENILDDYFSSNSNEISIACLRYFNPIGAHPSGLLGEKPNGIPTNIFPLLNKVAFGELDQIKIFGNDWETIDGTGVRDFIHVMDIAEGHLSTLDYLLENKNKNIKLNLGTGKGTSVLELINIFKNVNHVDIPYIFDNRRLGDRDIVYADNSLAKKILKWEPKRKVEEMCLDGWNWQLKNPKGY
tara:strand:+ start:3593 stop:4645 length:1053 start_codon:yes stop_codon:yes gene_type:complete